MNDFDYDVMQKKRIARGASRMKRGSKSKKCTLPSDYLTAAQKRRLNGPVNTYKLDEPMSLESFKAMPEDLQKQYILRLQENYGANDEMIGKMFKKSDTIALRLRNSLNIKPLGKCKLNRNEKAIRDTKWDAFCNGVVGGKPGEPKKIENDEVEKSCNEIEEMEPIEEPVEEPVKAPKKEKPVNFLMTEKLDVTFVSDSGDLETVFQILKQLGSHAGRCRIHIEIEAV